MGILKGMIGQLFPFIITLLLPVFFLVITPDAHITLLLAPLLACAWLIGMEILLLFYPLQTNEKDIGTNLTTSKGKAYGILSVILAYGFLLLPSHSPARLDGFPLEAPVEFITGAFVLPLTLIFGWKLFTGRFFVFSFAALFVVKLIFFLLLPQAGLGIYAFRSEETFQPINGKEAITHFPPPVTRRSSIILIMDCANFQ